MRKVDPDAIVLINPNNPTGNLISMKNVRRIVEEFAHLDAILLDESFIHFGFETDDYQHVSSAALVNQYENVIVSCPHDPTKYLEMLYGRRFMYPDMSSPVDTVDKFPYDSILLLSDWSVLGQSRLKFEMHIGMWLQIVWYRLL